MAKHYARVQRRAYGDGGPAEIIVTVHEDADDRVVESYIAYEGSDAPLRRLSRRPNGPLYPMAKRAFDNYSNKR